jgi:glycosyltransferase involved in cell wall biosynthesis
MKKALRRKTGRVLVSTVSFPPDFTGAGLRALRLCERLNRTYGINFNVLCSRKDGKYASDDDNKGISITRFSLTTEDGLWFPLHILLVFIKFNAYMIRNRKKIDVIHFFSFSWMNRIIMLSNILFYKKRSILEVTLDGFDDFSSLLHTGKRNKLFHHFTKFLLKRINRFILPSQGKIGSYIREGVSRNQLIVRPYAVDEEIFASIGFRQKDKLRKKLDLPNKFIMLNVGMVYPRKNQLFLIRCLELLNRKDVVLLLIGPDDPDDKGYKHRLQKYVNSHGLGRQVMFLGIKNNINEYMVASDVFVFSSESEGFPNVLAEATVSGLPIITLSLDCLDSLNSFINIETGKIIMRENFTDRDVHKHFTDALKHMLTRKLKYDRKRIRTLGLHHFSSKKADEKYLSIYSDLTDSKGLAGI